ncbi:hypothetical protein H2248_009677 [Termitomyces sp. 'cryptogamus']|nr:hypothetical protein H2248_009677 [Termitomyces sp. 'cryptogamus']
MTTSRSADTEYLVRNAMTTGYHVSSLLATPFYLLYAFSARGRGSFSINRLLRATWVGGLGGKNGKAKPQTFNLHTAVGTVASGGFAYAWYNTCHEDLLRSKRINVVYDIDRVRAEDHAIIGLVITSVLTTGIFWKRAGVVNLVLGGAGLGSSIGLLTHYGRSFLGDPPEKVNVPPII